MANRSILYSWLSALLGLILSTTAVWSATPAREARDASVLRVCADPNNLPFSNDRQEGFENKIAGLIAAELDLPLKYLWWPQTIGFVRNTLRVRECDLIIGIVTSSELVQNTNPYYRSVYVMVYRSDSGIDARSLSDPQLKDKRFGVVARTPPATLLARYGLIGKTKPYQLIVDTRHFSPGADAIADVAGGELDVALIWGPIAGYFIKRHDLPMTMVPMIKEPKDVRLDFRITMAVRYNEPEWKRQLNRILRKLQPQINQILAEYGVPLLDQMGQPIKP